MVLIAERYGFRSIDPIWDHPENAALRRQRPNPFVLAQGDQVFIPEKETVDHSCHTNQRHVFRVRRLTQWLEQALLDEADRPLAGKRYELKVGPESHEGRTNGQGVIRVEVPLDARTAELTVWLADGDPSGRRSWTLQIGQLEPVETKFGLEGHLASLGYDCGPVDDLANDQTRQALRQFQRDHHLAESGDNDAATQRKLRELFNYPVQSRA